MNHGHRYVRKDPRAEHKLLLSVVYVEYTGHTCRITWELSTEGYRLFHEYRDRLGLSGPLIYPIENGKRSKRVDTLADARMHAEQVLWQFSPAFGKVYVESADHYELDFEEEE